MGVADILIKRAREFTRIKEGGDEGSGVQRRPGAVEKLKQEHGVFEANLSCVTRACFKRELKRGGCGENPYKKGKRAKVF